MVLELQGPLFFGSAENLVTSVEKFMKAATYCILNVKHVSDIDSTGANILIQLKKRIQARGKFLSLSQLSKNNRLIHYLEVMNLTSELVDTGTYPDTDAALEWAEDHLLDRHVLRKNASNKVNISDAELFKGFSQNKISLVHAYMENMSFAKDEAVFQEGDETRDLYLLTKGKMSVIIYLHDSDSQKRLFTYAPCTVFGEMAFLDGGSRSASVWAAEASEVLCLPYDNFRRLGRTEPELCTKLIPNLAIKISGRLRRISNQVRLLEDG